MDVGSIPAEGTSFFAFSARLPCLLEFMHGLDDRADLAFEDGWQVVPGLLEAMIGDAVLRKIICADLLGAVAGADLAGAHGREFLHVSFGLDGLELGREDGEGALLVRILAALG